MPAALWQPNLLNDEPPSVDRSFATSTRRTLDASSWIDVVPGWLRGSDAVVEVLLCEVQWEQRQRWMYDGMVDEPRLSAGYERIEDAPAPVIVEAADALAARYRVAFDRVWLNCYRDGMDSTAWHGDRLARRRDEAVVAVITLGAPRSFLLRRAAGGRSITLRPASGDLLVMGGRCQRDWRHAVPKTKHVLGARLSVNLQSSDQTPHSA